MCKTPIFIKNPNYKKNPHEGYNYLKDCSNQYLSIPCGHCPECIAVKQMNMVQRVQMESKFHHVFFTTLTYSSEMLPLYHLDSCDVTSGEAKSFDIPYADISDFQNMVKRIRKYNLFPRSFKYAAVSERGSKKGRPHFHILWFLDKYDDDDFLTCLNLERQLYDIIKSEWRRNVAKNKNGKPNNRNPVYKPLFEYHERYSGGMLKRNYDTHYVNPALSSDGESDVAFYVFKYMLKTSDREQRLQQALKLNLPEDEYETVWNVVKSKSFRSLDFGLKRNSKVQDYLHSCVERGKGQFDYPIYINPVTGQTFPLARFYKDCPEIFSIDDAHDFYFNKKTDVIDSSFDTEERHLSETQRMFEQFRKMLDRIDMTEDDLIFA